jgi:hypothetical protein
VFFFANIWDVFRTYFGGKPCQLRPEADSTSAAPKTTSASNSARSLGFTICFVGNVIFMGYREEEDEDKRFDINNEFVAIRVISGYCDIVTPLNMSVLNLAIFTGHR